MKGLKRKAEHCPLCDSAIELYQINFNEAVNICENIKCPYPLECENVLDFCVVLSGSEPQVLKKQKGTVKPNIVQTDRISSKAINIQNKIQSRDSPNVLFTQTNSNRRDTLHVTPQATIQPNKQANRPICQPHSILNSQKQHGTYTNASSHCHNSQDASNVNNKAAAAATAAHFELALPPISASKLVKTKSLVSTAPLASLVHSNSPITTKIHTNKQAVRSTSINTTNLIPVNNSLASISSATNISSITTTTLITPTPTPNSPEVNLYEKSATPELTSTLLASPETSTTTPAATTPGSYSAFQPVQFSLSDIEGFLLNDNSNINMKHIPIDEQQNGNFDASQFFIDLMEEYNQQ